MRRVLDHTTGRLLGLTDDRPLLWLGAVVAFQGQSWRVRGLSDGRVALSYSSPTARCDYRLRDTGPRLEQMAHRGHEHTKGGKR